MTEVIVYGFVIQCIGCALPPKALQLTSRIQNLIKLDECECYSIPF